MAIQEYNDRILSLVKSNPKGYSALIMWKKSYRYLYEYIMKETSMYQDIRFGTRIYMILSGNYTFPKCRVCGKELRHGIHCTPIKGYQEKTCSNRCAQKDPQTIEKMRKTSLERYGCDMYQKTRECKDRIHRLYANKSKDEKDRTNQKRLRTCLEKYGVEHIAQKEEVKNKALETYRNRTKSQRLETIEKTRKTKLERYGDESYVNVEKIMQTRNSRTEEQKRETIEKRKKTCLELYGVNCTCNTETVKIQSKKLKRGYHYDQYVVSNNLVEPMFSREDYVEGNEKSVFRWKCRKCGDVFESRLYEFQSYMARCRKCYPENQNSTSREEREVIEFIMGIYDGQIVLNDRNIIHPRELDIYLPDIKVAIEFDGIHWHSLEMGTSEDYHLKKTEDCEKVGIRLLHIFEDEWKNSRDLVCSRIENLILSKNSDDESSSWTIVEDTDESGSIRVKVVSKDDVSIISQSVFQECGKKRFEMFFKPIIPRNSTKRQFGCVLKYFEDKHNPHSIIVTQDRRNNDWTLFQDNGFLRLETTPPRKWYFRHGYCDLCEDKTQFENDSEIMSICDCGTAVYEKTYDIQSSHIQEVVNTIK